MIRTAVLIHGCHLQADLNGKKWEDIVWGLDTCMRPTLSGRGTMGVKIAIEYGAELLIFSTGASERDGVKEGRYTYDFARSLGSALADAVGLADTNYLAQFLESKSELDLESQNTREECERNFRLCAASGIKRIILVSSAWHIERCHAEALNVAERMRETGETAPEILAVASHGSTQDLVVFEPPHRGDRPRTEFHMLGRRFFRIPDERIPLFEADLDRLLTSYGA